LYGVMTWIGTGRGSSSLSQLADAATRMLWSLIVWSIFGGAICRIAFSSRAHRHYSSCTPVGFKTHA